MIEKKKIWLLCIMVDVSVNAIEEDFHFLHVWILEKDVNHWLFYVVYASPHENGRNKTWIKLHDMEETIQEHWLMINTFNVIKDNNWIKETRSTSEHKMLSLFSNRIYDNNLMEVHTIGTKYGQDYGFSIKVWLHLSHPIIYLIFLLKIAWIGS